MENDHPPVWKLPITLTSEELESIRDLTELMVNLQTSHSVAAIQITKMSHDNTVAINIITHTEHTCTCTVGYY